MAETIIDHEKLVKLVLEQKGIIAGGYVRAWVAAGQPTDEGWEDIDCFFPNDELAYKATQNIQKAFGENAPMVDTRIAYYNKPDKDNNYKSLNLSFNTFYCCCWKFDGEFKTIEPATTDLSIDEMYDLTRNKIAKCIMPFHFFKHKSLQLIKMINYGWKIIDYDNKEIPEKVILDFKRRLKHVITRTRDANNQIVEKKIIFNN